MPKGTACPWPLVTNLVFDMLRLPVRIIRANAPESWSYDKFSFAWINTYNMIFHNPCSIHRHRMLSRSPTHLDVDVQDVLPIHSSISILIGISWVAYSFPPAPYGEYGPPLAIHLRYNSGKIRFPSACVCLWRMYNYSFLAGGITPSWQAAFSIF